MTLSYFVHAKSYRLKCAKSSAWQWSEMVPSRCGRCRAPGPVSEMDIQTRGYIEAADFMFFFVLLCCN